MTAPFTPRNILLTGGAGFIGSHVALHFLSRFPQYKIVVVDKLEPCSSLKQFDKYLSSSQFVFVRGDITDEALIDELLTVHKIDTILHFAAQTHVDISFGSSLVFTTCNVLGTHVLLEVARRHLPSFKRFIHVSTDEVYGENKELAGQFTESETIFAPSNPYAATKASAEMLVNAYQKSYALPAIITRGNNVYGPRQYPEKVVPKFIHQLLEGRPLTIHGAGTQTRNYLHVEDTCQAFDSILHKGEVGQTYNIGTEFEYSVLDVARDICLLLDKDPISNIIHVEDRRYNDQRYRLDSSRLIALGWKQSVSWSQGLAQTVEWYKANQNYWPDLESALAPHRFPSQASCTDGEELSRTQNHS